MTHFRIFRVNELIKETLAKIIFEGIDFPRGVFVTLTKIDTSIDLRYAKVFVSVFPERKFSQVLNVLRKNIYSIQGSMNRKFCMKPLPRIEFVADKTEVEAEKIEKMLKKIKRDG